MHMYTVQYVAGHLFWTFVFTSEKKIADGEIIFWF
jgi:hypothetical protein